MPVEMVNQPRCGVCGCVKGKTNRWFLARVKGKVFSYRDYDAAQLKHYELALCGMVCLDAVHHEHAAKLVGMTGVVAPRPAVVSAEILNEPRA